MQIVIAKKTVLSVAKHGDKIDKAIAAAMGATAIIVPPTERIAAMLEEGGQWKHYSIVEDNDENIVVDINDKVILKGVKLYLEMATLVGSIIAPMMALVGKTTKLFKSMEEKK